MCVIMLDFTTAEQFYWTTFFKSLIFHTNDRIDRLTYRFDEESIGEHTHFLIETLTPRSKNR